MSFSGTVHRSVDCCLCVCLLRFSLLLRSLTHRKTIVSVCKTMSVENVLVRAKRRFFFFCGRGEYLSVGKKKGVRPKTTFFSPPNFFPSRFFPHLIFFPTGV